MASRAWFAKRFWFGPCNGALPCSDAVFRMELAARILTRDFCFSLFVVRRSVPDSDGNFKIMASNRPRPKRKLVDFQVLLAHLLLARVRGVSSSARVVSMRTRHQEVRAILCPSRRNFAGSNSVHEVADEKSCQRNSYTQYLDDQLT